MEEKKYTAGQIKDAIWQELKESDYTGENNDRVYEIIGIVMAGLDKIARTPNPGLPPLPEPILTDEDVKDWEGEKRQPGAVWVKCSLRMPEISTPPELITVKRYHDAAPDNYSVRSMTAAQLVEFVKFDLATFEWLDESGTAAGREEDACDFAEWMRLNCKSSQNGWVDALGKWDTTRGWYKLFKQNQKS